MKPIDTTHRQEKGAPTQRHASYDFVELNRTFHELSKYARESDEFDLSEAFHVGTALTWTDLLKNYRTVILSEAGSGKTEEIRATARKLCSEGKAAFFLRLEHIANDFDVAFEVGSLDEFDAWLASNGEAWLLLDSVDEARLRDPRDFDLAVRKLGSRVKLATQRVHIILTGRAHAWRPKSDPELCERWLPFGAAQINVYKNEPSDTAVPEDDEEAIGNTETHRQENEPVFRIVALDDLKKGQIEAFSAAKGIAETKPFIDAIERADAWSFTSRPQDLQELVDFWLDQNRIGTRLEIMHNSIERRLTEFSENRAELKPLSSNRAREGVRLLAAATTLGRDQTIQIQDGTDNKNGIRTGSVLGDWEAPDQSTLLSRPIFDQMIYGTVRFHHRPVREYLAAEWLAELLKRPASRRSIEALLFRNQYGLDVIVPTTRPILPWLAILDEPIRERLRKIAPEVLFEGGDPSALPLPTRRIILGEVCEQIASDRAGMEATSYAAVQRFANDDLVEDIRGLLKLYESNDELRGFLVRMIWLGELKDLLPEAKHVALTPGVSKYTRIAAFRGVGAVGTAADHEELRQAFLKEAEPLDRHWLGELLSDLQPTEALTDWLLATVAKAADKEKYTVDHLDDSVTKFVEGTPLESLPKLITGLEALLAQPPYIEGGYCEVSKRFAWLLKAAAAGVERLIGIRHPFARDPKSLEVLYKLRSLRDWHEETREIKTSFATLVHAWSELNKESFWYDVRASRRRMHKKPGDRLTFYRQAAFFGSFWSFGPDDFEYACDAVTQQPEQDDKLVALSLAFDLYVQAGRTRPHRQRLKTIVAGNQELEERLGIFFKPPRQDWRKEERKWKRLSADRKKRDEKNREKSKAYLQTHLDGIRSPTFPDPTAISKSQWYLHDRIREIKDGHTDWTATQWRALIPEYGEEVARAYRDGVVGYWRKNKPIVLSEGATKNSTPNTAIFGLTGVTLEAAETPNWAATITAQEVELACRYATFQLNGWPVWFPKLFEAHPDICAVFLMKEIAYELSVVDGDLNYILSDISWSGSWAWNYLDIPILELLEKSDPQNSAILDKLLKIMQGSELSDEKLAELAARKTKTATTLQHAACWFAAWIGVEPAMAIPALESRLNAIPLEEQTTFAMQVVTRLWGSRRSETSSARPGYRAAQHLKSLYLLMHRYIRREDDIERAGKGVYSPGLRDEAQEARNRLFDELNKLSGKEAFLALKEIADTHPDPRTRAWIRVLMRRKAENDADIAPWTPAQVREFHEKLDNTPKTPRELADLAVLRFLDLKDELENGDDSVASILMKVDEETKMRNYLGHELRNKAFGRYSIPQEEELADAKRPDLRFHGTGFDGPIPTELKLADGWTGPQLFERLENQLAGDYLRDNRSNRGIFALVYRGQKQGWDVPNAPNRVDFDGLVEALQKYWQEISGRFHNIEDITVIGIDLTKRQGARRGQTI
ncbi:hypothetical protein [Nitrobacter sp. JJSN]|uniref:hypothetical protein n=1 Tax=Nitrobacter sp. JJSN TaxID=3453033 RepID=UPI003F76ECDB